MKFNQDVGEIAQKIVDTICLVASIAAAIAVGIGFGHLLVNASK